MLYYSTSASCGGCIPYKKKKRIVRKVSKPRAKAIKLNPEKWLTKTSLKDWSFDNRPKDGLCPILKFKPTRWVCDHDHFDSRVRGVISQAANTWEGYVLKSFSKYCQAYSEVSLSEALRNLADYLETPYWLENKLHFSAIDHMRKFLSRCTKETIVRRAKDDLNIDIQTDLVKEDMIDTYLEKYIELLEET